jgi:hypothetical protein
VQRAHRLSEICPCFDCRGKAIWYCHHTDCRRQLTARQMPIDPDRPRGNQPSDLRGQCRPLVKELRLGAATSNEPGQLHSYRGVLNDKGKAYLQLFKTCTERMISSGRMPAQQAYAGIRAFEEEIACLG